MANEVITIERLKTFKDTLYGTYAPNGTLQDIVDMVLAIPPATTVTNVDTNAGTVGTSTSYAREDHKHTITGFVPVTVFDAHRNDVDIHVSAADRTNWNHTHPYLRNTTDTLTGNLTVTGQIIANGDITAFSDAKLKSNVEYIENALDKVLLINGYTFDMNGRRGTGVIAQELRDVLPEAIHESCDGTLAVAYGNVIGLLINAIHEQQWQINELRGLLNV